MVFSDTANNPICSLVHDSDSEESEQANRECKSRERIVERRS